MPPVVAKPTKEGAVYVLGLLSATGTGILLSAIVGALVMKYRPVEIVRTFARTFWLVRYSLLTIVLMLGLGTLTRYSGTDTTLGLAFANSGVLYPFFGTLMGWIGVGVMTHVPLIAQYGFQLVATLVLSTWVGLLVTALVFRAMLRQSGDVAADAGGGP